MDPEDSQGLLGRLSASLESSLADQRRAIVRQFSLDDPESALTRFRKEISENNGQLRDDLRGSIEALVGEFSQDNKQGALTRLLESVESAQARITGEFTLDREDSAMARLRAELVRKLDEQSEASRDFQGRVESELARLAGRESVIALTPPGGLEFESTVYSVVEQEAQKTGDVAEDVSRKTGKLPRSKVGDFVVVLGEDSAAAGARIVGEVKDDKGYSLAQAREELAVAHQNRQADVGLFVFSEEAAPKNLRRLRRYGNDIVVVWDDKNRATDVFLQAALSLARALCTRPVVLGSMAAEDFATIEKAIHEIERQTEGLDEVRRLGATIENNSKKILSRVETMSESLGKQVASLQEKLDLVKRLMSSVS